MTSVEREPITGVWGESLQRVQGDIPGQGVRSPWSGGQGGKAPPPEADSILAFER